MVPSDLPACRLEEPNLARVRVDHIEGPSVGSCWQGLLGNECNLYEDIVINLIMEDLESYAASEGFALELRGQRGSQVVHVPATYLLGFLQALKAYHVSNDLL